MLSLLVVVVPAMAAYVATSADPANDAIGWPQAVAVGAALWLLGQGGALVAGGATVALVPLGITALVIFGCYASARRSAHPTVGAWLAAVGGHLAVVAVVLLGAGPTGPLGAGSGAVARTLLGSLAVAALGLGLGAARPGMLATWAAAEAGRRAGLGADVGPGRPGRPGRAGRGRGRRDGDLGGGRPGGDR